MKISPFFILKLSKSSAFLEHLREKLLHSSAEFLIHCSEYDYRMPAKGKSAPKAPTAKAFKIPDVPRPLKRNRNAAFAEEASDDENADDEMEEEDHKKRGPKKRKASGKSAAQKEKPKKKPKAKAKGPAKDTRKARI